MQCITIESGVAYQNLAFDALGNYAQDFGPFRRPLNAFEVDAMNFDLDVSKICLWIDQRRPLPIEDAISEPSEPNLTDRTPVGVGSFHVYRNIMIGHGLPRKIALVQNPAIARPTLAMNSLR